VREAEGVGLEQVSRLFCQIRCSYCFSRRRGNSHEVKNSKGLTFYFGQNNY